MNSPVIKWGALLFLLFFIFTAPASASGSAEGFSTAAVDFLDRVLQFVGGLLDGASST